MVSNKNQNKSWQNFIQHVEDLISRKYKPQFTEDISVKLKTGQTCHFNCLVTCLTQLGIRNSSDYQSIEKVAFIFDNNTEIYMREQLISQEKKHLNEMLSNVMPSRVVHSFMNSGKCISFIVQSVSIGMFRVQTTKHPMNSSFTRKYSKDSTQKSANSSSWLNRTHSHTLIHTLAVFSVK